MRKLFIREKLLIPGHPHRFTGKSLEQEIDPITVYRARVNKIRLNG
jgi:hypothetical protein